MVDFQPLDPKVPIDTQLGADAAPVALVNLFTVDPADVHALLAAWEHDANWMKRQPGYISTQLHRAIGGSRGQLGVPQLRGLGVGGALPGGVHASGVQERARRLSVERGHPAAPFHKSGGAEPVHRVTAMPPSCRDPG